MNKSEQKKIIVAGIIWFLSISLFFITFMGIGEGISEKRPLYRVDKTLEPYLETFVDLAALKGIDLTYIYDSDITIKFVDYDIKNNVASAYGRDKDKIIILVNRKKFAERTDEGRKYVMFHEFGHDILNFPHLEHPERGMMEPTAYTGFFKSYERFTKEIQEKYLYRSLNKMFDRFIGDGIADDTDWIIQNITEVTLDGEVWITAIWYAFDDEHNTLSALRPEPTQKARSYLAKETRAVICPLSELTLKLYYYVKNKEQ